MTYKLPKSSIETAILHLRKYGDTDVFPHLPEIAFLHERQADVINVLSDLDLEQFTPTGAIEALTPKGRFGFRIVHQMPLIDNVLFLASVIAIGALIEKQRLPEAGSEVFSYRFQPQKGNLFRSDRTFKAWLEKQRHDIQGNLKIKQVLATDISDFYARINFHRLENLLDKVAPNHGAAQYIKRHIKAVRARQSFGLPVGGSAARLLAELALSDTDRALADDGIVATRFVDDYRIFLHAGESPYDALAKLAEDLGINEGLSLNQAKTRVYSRAAYLKILDGLLADVADEAEGAALDALVTDLYFEDDPDDEELEKLKSMNLLGMLQKEMGKDPLDMGRIKVIFRALKIAKPPSAIPYLADNFSELAMFAREVTLLMQAL